MKMAVKMYGSHGGELDSIEIDASTEGEVLAKAKLELIHMIKNIILCEGDVFKIVSLDN